MGHNSMFLPKQDPQSQESPPLQQPAERTPALACHQTIPNPDRMPQAAIRPLTYTRDNGAKKTTIKATVIQHRRHHLLIHLRRSQSLSPHRPTRHSLTPTRHPMPLRLLKAMIQETMQARVHPTPRSVRDLIIKRQGQRTAVMYMRRIVSHRRQSDDFNCLHSLRGEGGREGGCRVISVFLISPYRWRMENSSFRFPYRETVMNLGNDRYS